MQSKLAAVAFFFSVAVTVAIAQDPIKVEPKHYKLDFENDRVQVLSVHYGPHEKSVLHEHPGGVVVALTEAHLRFTDENGKTREVFSKPGEVRWYPPFKHKVENLGDTTYDGVYIGVKGKLAATNSDDGPTVAMDTPAIDTLATNDEVKKIIAQYLAALTKQH